MLKKRFIAGAKCPKCSELDSLVVYQQDGDEFRECVECGFVEKMVFKPATRELETRVNVTENQKATETQAVKFVDFDKKK